MSHRSVAVRTFRTLWISIPLQLATLLAIAVPRNSAYGQEWTTTVRGMLADSVSAQPLQGVSVAVQGGDTTATDAAGHFEITLAHGRRMVIRFHRAGYRSMEVEIDFPNEPVPEVDLGIIPLPPMATALDPLRVEDTAPDANAPEEFYLRMERGVGHFITAEDITKRQPSHVSQLLRGVSSIRLRCAGPGNCSAATTRQPRQTLRIENPVANDTIGQPIRAFEDTLGTLCPMMVYVDGVRIPDLNVDVVPPADVLGVEVYTGAFAPARYRTTECGLVLIWTRRRQ